MAKVNYVQECRAFLQYACGKRLTANEVVLWHALFELMNREARGADWPEGFVPLANARVLSLTTFGSGDSACETLRRARERLARHGLIHYRQGRRQSAPPRYALVYFRAEGGETPQAEDAPETEEAARAGCAPELPAHAHVRAYSLSTISPRTPMRDSAFSGADKKRAENSLGKALGSPPGNPVGNPLDIPVNPDGNPNPNPAVHTRAIQWDGCHSAAALPAGRFDSAWKTSAKARGAVAQRLIDHFDGLMDARDAWGSLCELMEEGMPPETILREMPTRPTMNRLIARLRALAMCGQATG